MKKFAPAERSCPPQLTRRPRRSEVSTSPSAPEPRELVGKISVFWKHHFYGCWDVLSVVWRWFLHVCAGFWSAPNFKSTIGFCFMTNLRVFPWNHITSVRISTLPLCSAWPVWHQFRRRSAWCNVGSRPLLLDLLGWFLLLNLDPRWVHKVKAHVTW